MKTITFKGTKEDLLKLCDKAAHLGFTKALVAKQEILDDKKTEVESNVEDGFVDPTLDEIVIWARTNTKLVINQS